MTKAKDNTLPNEEVKAENQTKTESIVEESNTTIFDTKFMRVFKWFIPTLIVFVTLMINYAVKGIAPFGSKYVSYIDMEVGYVPVYYSLWDVVHSGGNLFYNFFLGAGSNVYGSFVSNALWSPLTWLVVIVPRSSISAFLSWFLIIKLSLMATTMYYFIRKVFPKVNPYLQILYSILWTFSGWTIGHYTNIIWLDNMILFPILCLGVRRIFREYKMDLFLVTLTFCLLFSFYMSFLVLLMLIFCGATAIYFCDKTKEEKKKITSKLVVGTLLALFISFISFLPAFWQSWTSYRITNAKKDILYENTWSKAILLCIGCFIMFGFVKLLTKFKQDKKNILMFIVMLAFTTITILVERINMMWHTGSYQSFPFRYAFVPIFILICSGLYYFNNHYKLETEKKAKKFEWTLIALLVAFLFYCVIVSSNMNPPAFPLSVSVFLIYAIGCGIGVFLLFRVFAQNNKKLIMIIVPIVCFVEILANCIGLVGINAEMPVNKASQSFTVINENLELPDDDYRYTLAISKLDNSGMIRYYNYPYIIRRQSLSTWLHIIGENQVVNANQLGYMTSNTVLTGFGSTYVANMSANVKYIISDYELSSQVYTLVDSYKGFYLYEYKYTLPYGGVFATEDLVESIPEDYQGFEASNYLYNEVYNMTGDLVTTLTPVVEELENNMVKYTLNVPANSLLYYNFANEDKSLYYEATLKINNQSRLFTYGIQEVGYYNNESVEFVVNKGYFKNTDELTFACIDVSKIQTLAENNTVKGIDKLVLDGNKIKATVNAASAGESIHIPFNLDNGWKAYVNGKEVKINKSLNTYMSVELQEGKNVIEFKFTPPLFNVGMIISFVVLALTLGLWLLNKYTKFMDSKIFNNIFFWVGVVGFAVASLLIYVKPFVETIIYLG